MQVQLLGQPVKHISFGRGIITDVTEKMVTIIFSQGEKKFLYPEAFSNYLTLKDTEKQNQINMNYNKMLQTKEAARKKELDEQERLRLLRTMKIAPNSQAAFNISLSAVKKIMECGCVSTGYYLSGYSKGEPRIPSRIKPNSACLLTGLPEKTEEKGRRILGAFMVREDFWGDRSQEGVIYGHDQYKVSLPSEIHLSYWDYFEHTSVFPRWGNVPFQYFPNRTMQDILRKVSDLLTDTAQGLAAKEFYQYFCEINRLAPEESSIHPPE